MNKFFSNTVKKNTLWAVVCAILFAAAIVVCALFGFNKDAMLQDRNTLTVSVNKYAYATQKELIISEAESKFGGAKADYVIEGKMSGDVSELVFVFDADVNVVTIKEAVVARFDALTAATTGALSGAEISVSSANEVAVGTVAKHFVLMGVIAGVLFAALAFGYVAARHQNATDGALAGGSAALAMLLTAALVILTRVPVTTSIAAVIAVSGMATLISVLLTLGKIRASEESFTEEKLASSIAGKETALFVVGLGLAIVVVGALGGTTGVWFAAATLLGLLSAAFVGLIVAPSAYLPMKAYAEAKAAQKGYVGAKKTSKKEKKVYEKKEVLEEKAEEPAAEEAEEVEEPAEEPVEEEAEEVEEVEESVEPTEENA